MNSLHHYFSQRFARYARWHEHRLHAHVHWGILGSIVTGVVVTFMLLGQTQSLSWTTDVARAQTNVARVTLVKLADSVMERTKLPEGAAGGGYFEVFPSFSKKWHWDTGTLMVGLWKAYEVTRDERYYDFIKNWVDNFINENGDLCEKGDARTSCAGGHHSITDVNELLPYYLAVKIYQETCRRGGCQEKYLTAALRQTDHVLSDFPKPIDGCIGLGNNEIGLDAAFMLNMPLLEIGSLPGHERYLNEAARQIRCQQRTHEDENTGLAYHVWDLEGDAAWPHAHHPPSNGFHSLVFWARGMGWLVVSTADVLEKLPEHNPERSAIIESFRKGLAALANSQSSSGRWYTVIDKAGWDGNYEETSGSAFFLYAFQRAKELGITGNEYQSIIARAQAGVLEQIKNDHGLAAVHEVSEGTNVGDYDYYVGRWRGPNWAWGDGAALLALAALSGGTSLPPSSAVCGNGRKESGEACDGSDFGGASCGSFGHSGGNLVCRNNCTVDTSACTQKQSGGGGFPVLEPNQGDQYILTLPPMSGFRYTFGDVNGDGKLDPVMKAAYTFDPEADGGRGAANYKVEAYDYWTGDQLWSQDTNFIVGAPEKGIGDYVHEFVAVWDMDATGGAIQADDGIWEVIYNYKREDGSQGLRMVSWDKTTQQEVIRKDITWPEPSRGRKGAHRGTIAYLDGQNPYIVINDGGEVGPGTVYAFDRDLNRTGFFSSTDSNGAHMVIAYDLDRDGKDEVIVGGTVLETPQLQKRWSLRDQGYGYMDLVQPGDHVPGNGMSEIYFLAVETPLLGGPHGRSWSYPIVVDQNGETVWKNTEVYYCDHNARGWAADVTGDGKAEFYAEDHTFEICPDDGGPFAGTIPKATYSYDNNTGNVSVIDRGTDQGRVYDFNGDGVYETGRRDGAADFNGDGGEENLKWDNTGGQIIVEFGTGGSTPNRWGNRSYMTQVTSFSSGYAPWMYTPRAANAIGGTLGIGGGNAPTKPVIRHCPGGNCHVAVFACNDGLDNDKDGFTDFPDDLQCRNVNDSSEAEDVIGADFNIPFPRVSHSTWGGAITDWMAKFDLIAFNARNSTAAVKSKNINTRVLVSRDFNNGMSGDLGSVREWQVRNEEGTICARYTSSDAYFDYTDWAPERVTEYGPNCTRQDPNTGTYKMRYNEYISCWMTDPANIPLVTSTPSPTGIDGVQTDGLYDGWVNNGESKCVNRVDLDRNRKDDFHERGKGEDWVNAQISAGATKVVRLLRERLDAINPNLFLVINSGGPHTFGREYTNGYVWEHFSGTYGFDGAVDTYLEWNAKSKQPSIPIHPTGGYEYPFAATPSRNDFGFLRFGLSFVLLGDGFYDFGDKEGAEHYWEKYFDEFDVELGYPKGRAQKLPNGAWARFYDQGVAVINGTDNEVDVADERAVTVTASDLRAADPDKTHSYYRFLGGQDTAVNGAAAMNNGQEVTDGNPVVLKVIHPFKIGPWGLEAGVADGAILVYAPATIVSDIYIDNWGSGTSPGTFSPPEKKSEQVIGFLQATNCDDGSDYFTVRCAVSMDPNDPATPVDEPYLSPPFATAPGGSNAQMIYKPNIGVPGNYEVYEWHGKVHHTTMASNVAHIITHASGTETKAVNQRTNTGQWNSLGIYQFNKGTSGKVTISAAGANGTVMADAIRLVYRGGSTQGSGPSCTPTQEVCDGKDNDCDTQVDEGGVCQQAPDTTPPVFVIGGTPSQGFDITPRTTTGSVTIAWNVSDNVSLKQIEIYRAPYSNAQVQGASTHRSLWQRILDLFSLAPASARGQVTSLPACNEQNKLACQWAELTSLRKTFSGTIKNDTDSRQDTPPVGKFWYGLHVVDTSGNVRVEPAPILVEKQDGARLACGQPRVACNVGSCPGRCDESGNTCVKDNPQCGRPTPTGTRHSPPTKWVLGPWYGTLCDGLPTATDPAGCRCRIDRFNPATQATNFEQEAQCQLQKLQENDIPITVFLADAGAWASGSSPQTPAVPDTACRWKRGWLRDPGIPAPDTASNPLLAALDARGIKVLAHVWGGCSGDQLERNITDLYTQDLGRILGGIYLDDGVDGAFATRVIDTLNALPPGPGAFEIILKDPQQASCSASGPEICGSFTPQDFQGIPAGGRGLGTASFVGDHWSNFEGLKIGIRLVLDRAQWLPAPYNEFTAFHFGAKAQEETYFRRLHWGAMQPVMAQTPWRNADPWPNGDPAGDYSTALLDAYRYWSWLHWELVPYLYSYVWNMYETNQPVFRESDTGAFTTKLGEEIFVAYVTDPGVSTMDISLPAGRWINYWDEQQSFSGTAANYPVALPTQVGLSDTFVPPTEPIFIKEGAIIPMRVEKIYTGHGTPASTGSLTILVYPKDTTSFKYYDDQKSMWITFQSQEASGQLTLTASEAPSQPVLYRIGRWAAKPTSVNVSGTTVTVNKGGSTPELADENAVNGAKSNAWYYDADADRLIVKSFLTPLGEGRTQQDTTQPQFVTGSTPASGFDVTPRSPQTTQGSVTISWNVSDNVALKQIEIYRAPYSNAQVQGASTHRFLWQRLWDLLVPDAGAQVAAPACNEQNKQACQWTELVSLRKTFTGTVKTDARANSGMASVWQTLQAMCALSLHRFLRKRQEKLVTAHQHSLSWLLLAARKFLLG